MLHQTMLEVVGQQCCIRLHGALSIDQPIQRLIRNLRVCNTLPVVPLDLFIGCVPMVLCVRVLWLFVGLCFKFLQAGMSKDRNKLAEQFKENKKEGRPSNNQ